MSSEINVKSPKIDQHDLTHGTIVIDRYNGQNIEVKDETVSILQEMANDKDKNLDDVIEDIKIHIPLISSIEAVHKMINEWDNDNSIPPLTDCVWARELLNVTLEKSNQNKTCNEWIDMHINEAKTLRNELSEIVEMYSSSV